MLRKTLIGAFIVALTPALAFAAPLTTTKARPAIHHTVKLKNDTHMMRKVKTEKIRLIQKHHAVKKMRVVTHLKHRTLTHKI